MATSVANPTPNPNPGTLNAVANEDGSITIYQANGCYITRFGGNPNWRNNNPGGLTSGTNDGRIGTDGAGHPIYPDNDAGRAAIGKQLLDNSRGAHQMDEALMKFGTDNGMNEQQRQDLLQKMRDGGVDLTRYWNSGVNQNIVINIIVQNAGYNTNPGSGYVGTQTEQICPGHGSDGN